MDVKLEKTKTTLPCIGERTSQISLMWFSTTYIKLYKFVLSEIGHQHFSYCLFLPAYDICNVRATSLEDISTASSLVKANNDIGSELIWTRDMPAHCAHIETDP